MSEPGPVSEQQQQLAQAVANLRLPQLVFNSFINSYSASEVTSVISFGPHVLATLIMPPVVAKSFAQALLNVVQDYESATGSVVGTIPELNERMAKFVARRQP
jgi:hypothetical protein